MTQGYVTPGWAWRHHRKWLRSLWRPARLARGRGRAPEGSAIEARRGRAERRMDRQSRRAASRRRSRSSLPDPALRFARTAERLEQLADGHPTEGWLPSWPRLARAQHAAAANMPTPRAPDEAAVAQAVAARIPPIAADGHRRDRGLARWSCSAARKLRRDDVPCFDGGGDRGPARATPRRRRGSPTPSCAAASIPPTPARLSGSPRRCRSISPGSPRRCRLTTSGCSSSAVSAPAAARPRQRASSPRPAKTRARAISIARSARPPGITRAPSASPAAARARLRCGASKAIPASRRPRPATNAGPTPRCSTRRRTRGVDPYADDLATLGLDMMVGEAGWSRHAPNPLLLVG